MRFAVELEYVLTIVETQAPAPLVQCRICLWAAHKDYVPLPQILIRHLEILANRNRAFIMV